MSGRLLSGVSHAALRALAADVRAQRGAVPEQVVALLPKYGRDSVAQMLELLAADREESEKTADHRVELVWSGPEIDGAATRDTAVVVRDLFRSARSSVLVSGYAVYDGASIFEALWQRWMERPELVVELYLNVDRKNGDTDPEAVVVSRHRQKFFAKDWPWDRRPHVFYDPRSLTLGDTPKSVLHAKCVIVDDSKAFVTSANLTEAAQYRNIEAGVLLNDRLLASRLASQFRQLKEKGFVRLL